MKANCVVCGKEFEKTHQAAMLCGSPECFRIYTERFRECVVCGNKFHKRYGPQKTCSAGCSGALARDSDHRRTRKYKQSHKEQIREAATAYRDVNREQIRTSNRNYMRKQYQADPEKYRKASRKHAQNNYDKVLKRNREWLFRCRLAQKLGISPIILAAIKLKEKLNEQDRDQSA